MATSTDLRAAIQEVKRQMPDEQIATGGLEGELQPDFATRLEQRVGALPWWVISAVVHAVLFLLVTLLGVALPPPSRDEVSITTDLARRPEDQYDEKKKRDIFKNPQEVEDENQIENPVVVHEQTDVAETFETDNDMDSQTARGREDAISDIPLGGTGVTGVMGVGGGGMAGCFGYRDGGGRKKAAARFGGSPATESAVEAALRWLARNQEKDGHWAIARHLPPGGMNIDSYKTGVTGLALLAFLGAGYTHKTPGRYQQAVSRGMKWLVKRQKKNGTFASHHSHSTYCEFICCLAVSEAYGMSKDPELKKVAQKSVDWALKAQTPYSGWRYHKKNDSDTSVVGWAMMALKSAKIAGLKVDGQGFQGITQFLDKVTRKNKNGVVVVRYRPAEKYSSGWERDYRCCTAIGTLCRQFLGADRGSPLIQGGAKYMSAHPPAWGKGKAPHFYYWYYGTLAMFQVGGEKWNKWNGAMKTILLEKQRKGGPMDGSARDVDGSWDPECFYGRKFGGRVYNTALGALTLEVYYRYLPVYGK